MPLRMLPGGSGCPNVTIIFMTPSMITNKIGASMLRPSFRSANQTNVGKATVNNTSVWWFVRPTPHKNAAR